MVINNMKKFEKLLKGHHYICFLDFEGTQFSHEIIAIGAVFCALDKNGRIKNRKPPFRIYVRAKNRVGNVVQELTGITDEKLIKDGVTFHTAMHQFKKYIGMKFNKTSFVTYNSHDMKMLGGSISYNLDAPKDICSQIQKNYIDYEAFLSEFVKDDKGNVLSLVRACELFNVPLAGDPHDPVIDSVNLANLYDMVLIKRDILAREYMKNLKRNTHYPQPILKTIAKIMNGQCVTPEEFSSFVDEYLS